MDKMPKPKKIIHAKSKEIYDMPERYKYMIDGKIPPKIKFK